MSNKEELMNAEKKPSKPKKKSRTQLMEEHKCSLHRTVVCYALMDDIPRENDKYARPKLASTGYYLMVMAERVESATEILDTFQKEANQFIEDHTPKEDK
jgi:hypothetical protein